MNEYKDYKVLSAEPKVSQKTGKSFKKLTIQAPEGNRVDVNIFPDFPDYANIAPGSVLRGALEQRGEYWNIVSETQSRGKFGASGGYKQKVIEETMLRKEQSIGRFQDDKEWSIMTASSMTNAVNLAIAEYRDKTILDTLDQAVLKWRKFILDNWEIDPKDIKPF